MDKYDLVVVGTGVAATTIATRVRSAGWSVAVVDFRPFGGTCALRGCDPKKVLVSGTEAVAAVRRLSGHGVAGDVRIRWPELMAFKRTFTDPVPKEREKSFTEAGIGKFHGRARFTGSNRMVVDGAVLEARYFVLAAGIEPIKLGIPGEEYLISNEEFLSLEQLPRRIAFVGGGYIAAEFSHIAARAGARATVLQRQDRMLPNFDPDLVGWLMESFTSAGIDVRTNTVVDAIERNGNSYRVRASLKGASSGSERSTSGSEVVDADLVVHAAGRAPALEWLDLDKAAVAVNKGHLELNEFLQSVSNPAVYAAGDFTRKGPPLTPIASYDAKVVAANLLEGNHVQPNYAGVPSVAFTIPPIAMVGLSEERARNDNRKFRRSFKKVSDWYTARRIGESVYGFKILIEEQTDRILGAHLVGPSVDETINLFAMAIRHGLTAAQMKDSPLAYPTGASDISYMLS